MRVRGRLAFGLWILLIVGTIAVLLGCEQQPMAVATPDSAATLASASGILPATLPPTTAPTETTLPQARLTPQPATASPQPSRTPTQAATARPTGTSSPTLPATTPRPTLAPVEPGLIQHGDRSRPWVALTFDAWQTADSEAGYDADIIRILTETQTSATLFLGGLWMQSHVTQTQVLAGIPDFELGNLSWSYPDFADLADEKTMAEIGRTQDLMHKLTGQQPSLFRLPFGTYQDESLEIVAAQGLKTVLWDVVTGDADPNILAEDILQTVKDGARNGSIIVMHMNARGWHTAEALPSIIEELKELGFELVTVSQMLEDAPLPTGVPSEGNATVSKGLVNVRQEATTDATILGTLEEGERIAVLCSVKGQKVPAYETSKWYRIEYQDGQGYILAVLVAPEGDVAKCD